MKKTVVAFAIMSIGLGAAQAQEVVKLGSAAPLTGTIAHLGKDLENGTRMAVEALNAQGVTIGG
ncbi:MAG: ABC transporter substrate-binding protein, partial [Proteobacteria bacterium]|nr:ABC transporter substrate-binding protein [Pseudomonadota bacterium]